jgi:hypothetical protein
MTEKGVLPFFPIYRDKEKTESLFWPPRIVWGREYGWLNVRDPVDGTWFSIPVREAPRGWGGIASMQKLLDRARR